MKLSPTSVLLCVLFGHLVSANPIPPGTNQDDMMVMNPSAKSDAVGAAYFITNEPGGNFVVSADICSNGELMLRQAVSTGGKGAHGVTDPAGGPDPLFSQGAVKVSAAAKMIATVNAGSNTVSIFSINPNDPAKLSMTGKPMSTGGEFPMSLAFNKEGTQLCVLNGGKVNGVNCFNVDQKKGLRVQRNTQRDLNINQTTPATGPAGSLSHVIFSEDGKQLVASVKGIPPTPGFLAVWDVQNNGSLSEKFQRLAPQKGGLLPFSMTAIPGQNAILATDAGLGFDVFDMSKNSGAKGNNTKSSANAIKGQKATCWSSFSPKTKNFYLTDVETSMVTEVNLDQNLKGSIVNQYPQGNNSGTIDNDIASIGDNDFMYVMSANATAVNVISLNAPGDAQPVQKLDIAGPAEAAGLPVSKDNLQGMATFIKG